MTELQRLERSAAGGAIGLAVMAIIAAALGFFLATGGKL